MTGITLLGATGTIGINTLKVIRQHPDLFEIIALTAHRDVERLTEQCRYWSPRYAVMADAQAAEQLRQRLRPTHPDIEILAGMEGLIHVAQLPDVDKVMAAIVGGAGLLPVLAAARAGKFILLANKEALVMGGSLFMDTVRQHHATLLPIDSEHNAIFQCMPPAFTIPLKTQTTLEQIGVRRILLTASGGPFRNYPPEQLHDVTPEQACAHPNWRMGRKISVDSATMMNKGLEVIEACWLFSTVPEQIEVLLHPQSIVHSLVEYVDGSVLAQMSYPDMRVPIAQALAWPQRIESGVTQMNLATVAPLAFETVDAKKFPCLQLAYEALKIGGTATTILNAANEVAVDAFLRGRLRFTAIADVIEKTLSQLNGRTIVQLETILEDDARARELAHAILTE